jgi:sugar fermentation stimulation protein A
MAALEFPALQQGRLLRRYKRFLADVELPGGQGITVFVPNTGSLLGCVEPGSDVWLRPMTGKGKYEHCLTLIEVGGSLVCVDTGIPNRVVLEASKAQQIPELSGYKEYLPEVPYAENCRADIICRIHDDDMLERCWVEIKATTLNRGGVSYFPDCVTDRGCKHLIEMRKLREQGDRVVQLYFVQRADCSSFRPAEDIDPRYAAELRLSAAAGVEIVALRANVSKRGIHIERHLPVEL